MLELKKLIMRGFGVNENQKIVDFSKGLNLINAENGKGKSTSIHAIEMLLIDNFNGNYEQYINYNSDNFFISLNFNINNKEYIISLECKKSKNVTTTRILTDAKGNELATGNEAKLYLAELLNPDVTKYALVSKQKSIDNITTCSDSERRELFKKIKNLDYSKFIDEKIVPKITATKEEIVQVDKEIFAIENYPLEEEKVEKDLPFTEKEKRDKAKDIEKLNAEKLLVEEKVKQKIEKEKQLKDNKELLSSKETSIIDKRTLKDTNENKLLEIPSSIENLNKDKVSNIDRITAKYEQDLKEEKEKVEKEKVENTSKLESLHIEIDNKTTLLKDIKLIKIAKFDDTLLEDVRNSKTSVKTKLDICKSNIEKLVSGKCPTCGQDCGCVTDKYTIELEDLQKKMTTAEITLENILREKKEYEDKVELNENKRKEKDTLQMSIDKLQMNINSLELENNSRDINLEKSLELLENKYNNDSKYLEETLIKQVELLEKEKELLLSQNESIDKDISALEKEKVDIELSINNLEKDLLNTELSSFDSNLLDSLLAEVEDYDNTVRYNESVLEFNKKLELTIKENNEKLENFKNDKLKLQSHLFNLESARNVMLKDFPNWVITQSVIDIENSMNQFITDIYYKELNISLRSTNTSIKLEYGNGKRQLSANRLSGSEQKIIDLSFMTYFNRLLDLQCLCLDEPDSAMDSNRKEELYSVLLNMSDVYQQLVIISHSQEMINKMMAGVSDCNLIILD